MAVGIVGVDSLIQVARRPDNPTLWGHANEAIALPSLLHQNHRRCSRGLALGSSLSRRGASSHRLTKASTRNNEGIVFAAKEKGVKAKDQKQAPAPPVHEIEGACPAMTGRVRVRYSLNEDLKDATETPWVTVTENEDGIHQFKLEALKPGST